MAVYQNSELIDYREYSEWMTYPVYVSNDEYEAGDEFWMWVEYYWMGAAK
jgi:hypothetical protein